MNAVVKVEKTEEQKRDHRFLVSKTWAKQHAKFFSDWVAFDKINFQSKKETARMYINSVPMSTGETMMGHWNLWDGSFEVSAAGKNGYRKLENDEAKKELNLFTTSQDQKRNGGK